MSRVKNPKQVIVHLPYSSSAELYEITEAGVAYQFPFALRQSLKRSYNLHSSVETWYNQLNEADKEMIVCTVIEIHMLFYNDCGFMVQ